MGGGGFLYEMNKAIERNKAMLKKKPLSEKLEPYRLKSGLGKDWTYKKANKSLLKNIRKQVAADRKRRLFKSILAFTIIATSFGLGSWAFFDHKISTEEPKPKLPEHTRLFTTKIHQIKNGVELKVDHLKSGPKSAETKYKDGKKHQNSESYYSSGEQFRSATYFYDTLVVDYHFFKNGDTIRNFPRITDNKVHHLAFRTEDNSTTISFDYWDGKIIPGTYQEYNLLTGEIKKEANR
ncbi:MAG: hypothetical protein AAGG59_06615 [Bacteroidota bacterium]